ncbi:putative protein disulfide-isomerase [Escovopsis weberi]|uniref:protein disulfide-isomerase n=1 Tax=Escovopsis weberi TaxID=150374 RepID=A0A0N0RTK1_ESCWE|nr:putative protein disulfide-isomerase [Escovopsis weberi]
MHQATLLAALAASLSALPAVQAGMYTKSSPVLQVDARSYARLIAESNHTSIVEFYAPWCGHCQNLKPAYEKAARNLAGLAKVAAVDCDDDANKAFCGSMNVKGFPTLKIVHPGKKFGRPVVEDYQGARTASAITEAVVGKIKDHVRKVKDKDVDAFLGGEGPKALLFTEKGTTSALLKSIAIDFLGAVSVGQVRDKEKAAVARFGITEFPKLVLVPGEGKDHIVYDGELNKHGLVEFLRQVAEPNPDPAPAKGKEAKAADKKKADKKKPEPEAADETPSSSSSSSAAAAAPEHTLIEIAAIDKQQIEQECLQSRSSTCVLALVPAQQHELKDRALDSLNQLNTKYLHGKRHTFPFYSLSSDVAESSEHIRKTLGLENEVELIVINARRLWWRRYEGDMGAHSVEAWIDAVRLGEGEKSKLPKEIIVETAVAEEEVPEPAQTAEPEPEVEAEAEAEATEHDEL